MGYISRLLKIERSEFSIVLDFTLLGALLQIGIALGLTAGDTLFLTKVGADKLPVIYALTPVIFLFYIPLYSFLTSKLGINYVFKITLSILALGGLAVFLVLNLFEGALSDAAVYIAKLYSILWYIALYTLFWNFVDGYFNILDAKRIFSALSAGCALGAAIGGAIVAMLSSAMSVDEFFLLWSITAAAAYPVLCRCIRRWRLIESEVTNTSESHGIIEESRALVSTFRSSKFSVVLGMLLFSTMMVTLICEYQYSHILSNGRSEEELAKLFGLLFLIVNAFNLLMNLLVFNRLALYFGVRNVAMIQPVVYMLAFVFFIFEHSMLAGIFGFFAFHGILTSIDYNNTNLLINALPKESKRQLRTFIEGICEPMANAVAGIFLIFMVSKLSPVQISSIGLAGASLCLLLAILLRSEYLQSMISNLKKSWLDFNATASSSSSLFRIEDSQEIEKLLMSADSLRTVTRRELEILISNKGLSSVPLTVKVLKDKSSSYRSRSVAARALARLSPTQLEWLSGSLIFQETKMAALYAGRKDVLSASGSSSSGITVLTKFYEDQEKIILDFVLELLALNGRVASFELLQVSLRSSNKKERADAIEAIQQACDPKTNRLILPLLSRDGNITGAIKADFESLYEVIIASLNSPLELEASAAAEALSALEMEITGYESVEKILRLKLRGLSEASPFPDLLVNTLLSVITRLPGQAEDLTVIGRIALMLQADFFKGFSCEDLRKLAENSECLNIKKGSRINYFDEDSLFILTSGSASEGAFIFREFDVIGESLYSGSGLKKVNFNQDSSVLKVPRKVITPLLEDNSRLSIWIMSRIEKQGKSKLTGAWLI